MSADRLYEEVHYLALHYHWAEDAILRLARGKRRRYLGLLARHFDQSKTRSDLE